VIHVIDLSALNTIDIKEKGSYAVPLGFMQEDLVYGIVRPSEIDTDAAGNTIIPMYQIKIVDISGDEPVLQKQYQKDGYYVASVEISDATMYLNRIKYNGSAYVEADQDMIMNREGDTEGAVTLGSSYTDEKETQICLLAQGISVEKKTKLLTPKETILEELPIITLEKEDSRDLYYVYAKGHVVLSTDDVALAVSTANDQMGVVIDDSQQYIWKRSRKNSVTAIRDISQSADDTDAGSITLCINAMLQKEDINVSVGALIQGGESPKDVLQNAMREMTVIDLTGCDVEETLYYISLGNPVFAMTGSSSAVLLTGYDSNGVTLYDPVLKMSHRETLTAAKELFSAQGNIFLTYIN
jgi:hypothetical protein